MTGDAKSKRRPPKLKPPKKLLVGSNAEAVKLRKAAFVEEFMVNGHNVERAAIKAGFSKSSAGPSGALLLRSPDVQAMLEKRAREVSEAAEMNTENWAKELRAIAFARVGDLFATDGRPLNPSELPGHVQSAVKSVRVSGRTVEYTLWSKTEALDMMAKHRGLFERDNAQKIPDVIVDVRLVG